MVLDVGVQLMEELPFVKALNAPAELAETLLHEEELYKAVKAAEMALAVQQAADKKEGYFGDSEKSKELADAVAKAQNAVEESKKSTSKAIDKHYRAMSRTMHPDRHGEESRPAFERLAMARNCLRDAELRHLYLDQMLQIVQTFGASFAESSHFQWVTRNMPDVEPQKTPEAGTYQGPLQLTGGITNDTPRKPYVSIIDIKTRRVRITLDVSRDTHHFYQYCTSVRVLASSGVFQEEIALATVKGSGLEVFKTDENPFITVEVTFPSNSQWYVKWFAALHINGDNVRTPHSVEAVIDLTTPEQLKRREDIAATDELAKRRAGEIHGVVHRMRGTISGHSDIHKKHHYLHQAVASGRSTLNRLLHLLREDGSNESTVSNIVPLREALESAAPVKAELDAVLAAHAKKDSLKEFKTHVADMLEQGEAASWLESASIDDMKSLGGEPNRLYQLLVEGKGMKYSVLELDAATLDVAAKRTDIFTPKQCQTLTKRKQEVEEKVAAEAERALAEAKREREMEAQAKAAREAAEAENRRREVLLASLRARATKDVSPETDLPTGARVQIHGLTSAVGSQLNGSYGKVELKQGERYIVRCHKDGRLRSFPATSLSEQAMDATSNGDVPTESWSCEVCTFLHEGPLVKATTCDMCQAPRETKRRPGTARDTVSPTSPQRQKKSGSPRSPNKRTDWVETEVPQPKSRKGTKAQGKGPSHPKTIATANTTKKQQAVAESAANKASQSLKKHRCKHGKNCRYLKLGVEKCKFRHTLEEIQAVAEHSERIFIEPAIVGWIIGKNGSHIQELIEESGAEIWIDQVSMGPDELRIVNVVGTKASVEVAVRLVKETVERVSVQDGKVVSSPKEINGVPSAVETAASSGSGGATRSPPSSLSSPEQGPSPPDRMIDSAAARSGWNSPQCVAHQPEPKPESRQGGVPEIQGGLPPPASTSTFQRAPGQPAAAQSFGNPSPPNAPSMGVSLSPVSQGTQSMYLQHSVVPTSTQMPMQHVPESQPQMQALRSTHPEPQSAASRAATYNLLMFLKTQEACLKGSPEAFCQWLVESEDIASLSDLADAISDEEYLQKVLQQGSGSCGVKGFKRAAFKKAVLSAVNGDIDGPSSGGSAAPAAIAIEDYPPELVCPISYVLMTTDPVIASDGHTYERSAIEAWFEKQRMQIDLAWEEIATGSNSQLAQEIYERGVLSPLTNTKMPHLHLTPNHAVRTMARDIARMSL